MLPTTRITSATASRSEELKNDGWSLTASYLLTGEEASFKGVKPARAFDPVNGGWGAWELVACAGELEVDKDAFYASNGTLGSNLAANNDSFALAPNAAQSAENWGVGVNWYPAGALRVSLDYEETGFEWGGGGTSTAPRDREDERVLLGRVQVSF